MQRGRSSKIQVKQTALFSAYGQFTLLAGAAAILSAIWFHTSMPIIVVGTALYCTLAFFNGFGT